MSRMSVVRGIEIGCLTRTLVAEPRPCFGSSSFTNSVLWVEKL